MQEIVLDMVTVPVMTVLEVVVTVLVVTVLAVLEVVVVTDLVVTVVIGPIVALPPLIAVATALLRLALRSSIIHPEGAALTSIAH